ncbi:GNAT family N-acetyltransferase [Paenibacillus albus]|uniref:GNAT family N-acetyltransferase n=1 Tax=Paenibacillus albus TaxID=2495582 RepID=A0A3Q8X4C2_9BACL|nr:GNAT family N-acetyltransferase [Paenibacillus albus]AZN39832.1 GNAT family N-acetyltransferase [Paenibacillus albus]
MLQTFDSQDPVLNQIADEVQYNLIHRICESKLSKCIKTADDTMIYAQSEGNNAWLWISKQLAEDERNHVLHELLEVLEGPTLPGVTGDPVTVEHFARLYSEANALEYFTHMTMEAYSCPGVKKPSHVKGSMHPAAKHHVETVAKFLAGFSEDAHGAKVDPASQISAAEGAIGTGNLYLWIVDSQPVSMAKIAHRSTRHARINAVYTPPVSRKNGYASAIVAELCSVLEGELLEPMLYADLQNPDSNKVYQNIGFVARGNVVDIKFKAQIS